MPAHREQRREDHQNDVQTNALLAYGVRSSAVLLTEWTVPDVRLR